MALLLDDTQCVAADAAESVDGDPGCSTHGGAFRSDGEEREVWSEDTKRAGRPQWPAGPSTGHLVQGVMSLEAPARAASKRAETSAQFTMFQMALT
ncbi:hypothetical protein ACFFX0_03935 [Citricoccus parietis]|uniref:Uncharacterized protein n=1 Tax=Citricoccus parietis TaxID=592307 RepID=A0ABV5FUM7_9MICC